MRYDDAMKSATDTRDSRAYSANNKAINAEREEPQAVLEKRAHLNNIEGVADRCLGIQINFKLLAKRPLDERSIS